MNYYAHNLNALELQRFVARNVQPAQQSETVQSIRSLNEKGTQYGSIPAGFCAAYPQEVKS